MHKFPRYSFSDLLDLTPAALQYLTLQALNLDMDMANKLGAVFEGAAPGGAPSRGKEAATQKDMVSGIQKMGFKVRGK